MRAVFGALATANYYYASPCEATDRAACLAEAVLGVPCTGYEDSDGAWTCRMPTCADIGLDYASEETCARLNLSVLMPL